MTRLNGPMIYFVMLLIALVSFLLSGASLIIFRLLLPEIHAVHGEVIQTWLFFSASFALPLFGINLWWSVTHLDRMEKFGDKLTSSMASWTAWIRRSTSLTTYRRPSGR